MAQIVNLTDNLKTIQTQWQNEASPIFRDKIYLERFSKEFVPLFAELPMDAMPKNMSKPKILISTLGFSWQPVALMIAWAKPEKVLILGTKDSLGTKDFLKHPIQNDNRNVIELIKQMSQTNADIYYECLDNVDNPNFAIETELYKKIQTFIQQIQQQNNNFNLREIFIDATAGKKSMSIATGLAAFLEGSPLVYIDYTTYVGDKRIPLIGTEFPRMLRNPLEEFGAVEFKRIEQAFNNGNYSDAKTLSQELEKRLYDPYKATLYLLISEAYLSWSEFNFSNAKNKLIALGKLVKKCSQPSEIFNPDVLETCKAHIEKLETLEKAAQKVRRKDSSLTENEGMLLIINHLAMAERAFEQNRLSICTMSLYATLERYTGFLLKLKTGFEFEKQNPDYSVVTKLLQEEKVAEVAKTMFGTTKKGNFSGPFTFVDGIILLASAFPTLLPSKHLAVISDLRQTRNQCEFEHHFIPNILTSNKVKKFLNTIKTVLTIQISDLTGNLTKLCFPKF